MENARTDNNISHEKTEGMAQESFAALKESVDTARRHMGIRPEMDVKDFDAERAAKRRYGSYRMMVGFMVNRRAAQMA